MPLVHSASQAGVVLRGLGAGLGWHPDGLKANIPPLHTHMYFYTLVTNMLSGTQMHACAHDIQAWRGGETPSPAHLQPLVSPPPPPAHTEALSVPRLGSPTNNLGIGRARRAPGEEDSSLHSNLHAACFLHGSCSAYSWEKEPGHGCPVFSQVFPFLRCPGTCCGLCSLCVTGPHSWVSSAINLVNAVAL